MPIFTDKEKVKTLLSNLISQAYIDGTFEEKEQKLIEKIGLEKGLNEEEIQYILNNPRQNFDLKLSLEELFDQAYFILLISKTSDEFIDEEEKNLCASVIVKMGCELPKAQVMVEEIASSFQNKEPYEDLKTKIKLLIQ